MRRNQNAGKKDQADDTRDVRRWPTHLLRSRDDRPPPASQNSGPGPANPDATCCVYYSSIREVLNSQDLEDRIASETQKAIAAELGEEQAAVDQGQRLATKMEKRNQDAIVRAWEG